MCLDVFLQVLRTLECFSTEFTFVWLQGNVDSNMGGDVVAFDRRGATSAPSASEIEVVCALAADMAIANVLLSQSQP